MSEPSAPGSPDHLHTPRGKCPLLEEYCIRYIRSIIRIYKKFVDEKDQPGPSGDEGTPCFAALEVEFPVQVLQNTSSGNVADGQGRHGTECAKCFVGIIATEAAKE